MDFTLKKYIELLNALIDAGYQFVPFCEFSAACGKVLCLRHDVDKKPSNSLRTAGIEAGLGIRATYYFRAVPSSWNEDIIKAIAEMGHEVGYHYESLSKCDGDVDKAYSDFKTNLESLRAIVPVKTICMHGSPRSPYDSKDIWKTYSYRELDILGEPYLDIDWSETFYLTDTGRCWDGCRFSVRDKIPQWQDVWQSNGLVFHRTDDIIERAGSLPDRLMITTHPQRWNGDFLHWVVELVLQNAKNFMKSVLINHKLA